MCSACTYTLSTKNKTSAFPLPLLHFDQGKNKVSISWLQSIFLQARDEFRCHVSPALSHSQPAPSAMASASASLIKVVPDSKAWSMIMNKAAETVPDAHSKFPSPQPTALPAQPPWLPAKYWQGHFMRNLAWVMPGSRPAASIGLRQGQ